MKSFYIDILALPGKFMSKKGNALFHLKYVCPKCPKSRRKLRDVHGTNACWWEDNWKKGIYSIKRDFGLLNYLSFYLFYKTHLKKYKKHKSQIMPKKE